MNRRMLLHTFAVSGVASASSRIGLAVNASEPAIIEGGPTKEGETFVFRLQSTPGTKLPPHYHATDEPITVLSGVFCIGEGDKSDEHQCKDMLAGSYITRPRECSISA